MHVNKKKVYLHAYLYIGGLIDGVACNSTNQSLIQNMTCNGPTTSHSINDCIINEGSCTCQKVISLNCYGKKVNAMLYS